MTTEDDIKALTYDVSPTDSEEGEQQGGEYEASGPGRSNSKMENGHYSMIQDTRISRSSYGQDGWDPTLWRNAMTMV